MKQPVFPQTWDVRLVAASGGECFGLDKGCCSKKHLIYISTVYFNSKKMWSAITVHVFTIST